MVGDTMIRVEAELTGCQCACNHCLTYGHKNNFNMSMEEIELIFKNMKDYSNEGYFFPLFDITNHPEFINILELSNKYGFKRDCISTNGVHEFTFEEFEALRNIGIVDIQLAFHGIGYTHDKFVHYEGAYDKLISLINRAGEFGFKFWNILFINKENAEEIEQLINVLKELKYIRNEDIGIGTYQYIGRAMRLKNAQFTKEEFTKLKCRDDIKPRRRFTESEWLEIIKEDEWNKPIFLYDNSNLDLHIDRNFNVYFKDYNPFYFYGLPNSEQGFKLGNLKAESLTDIIERTNKKRPPYIAILENNNLQQVAEIVGKKEDILYTFNDVPQYKWAYDLLKMKLNETISASI